MGNSNQLVNDIKDSIRDIERRRPGVGWIRGNQALDPTVYKELEDVRRQNKELREKLDGIGEAHIVFPSHLSHGSDLFKIEYTVRRWSVDNRITGHDTQNFEISWEDLFIELGEGICRESDEYQIVQGFRHTIGEKENKDYNDIEVNDLYIEQARYQLEALDLIKAVRKGGGMTGIAWTFTDKGRRYLSHLKALKRLATS